MMITLTGLPAVVIYCRGVDEPLPDSVFIDRRRPAGYPRAAWWSQRRGRRQWRLR